MPEVLLTLGIPRPVGALGVVEDDAGLGPALVVVAPHVPVGLGVGAVLAALLEPRVLVAGVVHHEIGHDADAPLVGLVHQLDHVGQDAVGGVDRKEVTDVVPAVAQRRGVEGQEPDAVDAQPVQVIESLGQAAEVASAVAAGVGEPPQEDFVEHRSPVPVRIVEAGPCHPAAILPSPAPPLWLLRTSHHSVANRNIEWQRLESGREPPIASENRRWRPPMLDVAIHRSHQTASSDDSESTPSEFEAPPCAGWTVSSTAARRPSCGPSAGACPTPRRCWWTCAASARSTGRALVRWSACCGVRTPAQGGCAVC